MAKHNDIDQGAGWLVQASASTGGHSRRGPTGLRGPWRIVLLQPGRFSGAGALFQGSRPGHCIPGHRECGAL